jgi:predicted nucleic acid-binding protein
MTIADTDVLIDFLAGKGEANAVERMLRRGVLRTTVINRFELLSGGRVRNNSPAFKSSYCTGRLIELLCR